MLSTFRAALLLTAVLLTACRATAPTVTRVDAEDAAVETPAPAPDAPAVTAIPETPAAAATPLTEPAAPAAPAAPSPDAPVAYDRAELRGKLHLPPGQLLPDGVRMQLVLLDRFAEDPSRAVLARAEQPVTGPAPIAFTLGYDRGLVADPTRYVIDVALRDITGRLLYRSAADHPVNLSPDAEPARVDLHVAR